MNRRYLALFSVALIAGCRSAEPQPAERAVTLRQPVVERSLEPASAASPAKVVVTGIVTSVQPTSARAQGSQDSGPELPFKKEEPKWEFLLAPYLWAAGIEGLVEADGNAADLDLEFGDILDDLEFGGSLFFEGHRDRWGFLIDGTYLALEGESEVQPGVDADTETDVGLIELDGFYRLSKVDTGSMDVIAGLRHLNVQNEVTIPGQGTGDGGLDSTMGVLGARGSWYIAPRWELRFRGDIGLGSGSDRAYQILGNLGWKAGEHWGLSLGYRWMDLEVEDSDTKMDSTLQGVMLGLLFGW